MSVRLDLLVTQAKTAYRTAYDKENEMTNGEANCYVGQSFSAAGLQQQKACRLLLH